jgi:hypothetical protein
MNITKVVFIACLSFSQMAFSISNQSDPSSLRAQKSVLANKTTEKSTLIILGNFRGLEDSRSTFTGVVHKLKGSFLEDGLLLRLGYQTGLFSYKTTLNNIPNSKISVNNEVADLMLGYQNYFSQSHRISYFVGAICEQSELSPNDPFNETKSEYCGAKAQAEYYISYKNISFNLLGNYEVESENFWASTNLMYDTSWIAFGAEYTLQGNQSYDQSLYGIRVSKQFGAVNLGLSYGEVKQVEPTHEYDQYLNINASFFL